MTNDEYDKVELPALQQLQQLGWTYLPGAQFAPSPTGERTYFREVVLEKRLAAAMQRINPWISDENLRKVVRETTHPVTATLMEANQNLWQNIVHYQSVEQDLGKGRKGQTVRLIDFDNIANNEFLCVNQFKIEGINESIIPDIVLFVNGLPLAVIEAKSPYVTNPMENGINQLRRYANRRAPHEDEGVERLFWYNQLMVCTHRDQARVGTISSKVEHYLEWKDAYPFTEAQVAAAVNGDTLQLTVDTGTHQKQLGVAEQAVPYDAILNNPVVANSQQILLAGLFSHANFLDVIQNFTLYEPVDGRVIKKIARYQQFRAVHKTIHRLKTGTTKKDKGGIIWHTQGSGKSLTMVMLAIKMRRDPALRDYKLVFVTDRTQLDSQLTAQFERAQGETVYHAKSVAHLKELLARDSADLVTAMVQKFQESEDDFDFPELNTSEKIIVLADEAHRTQYGTLGVAINAGLPNAPKIAFTGTPLITSQKTSHEFGTYIDTYTIEEAVADGATCQILYEGREAKTKVTGDSLDKLFDEYFADRSAEDKAAIKKKYGTEQAVLEAPQRIRWVCIDLLKHYREHIQPNGFKAMIVTSSRRAAVLYKQAIDELEGPETAVIISGMHNDDAFFAPYTDSLVQKQQIDNFKKPIVDQPLSIIVVKDMLLTGFDAPVCQVMYLDRKLKEHSLLQAIARVNRTASGKARGYIVDYFGLSDYLTEALDMFSKEDVAGALQDLKDEIPKLKAMHTRVMGHFKGIDIDNLDACILALKDEDKRQHFEIDFKKFAKQMDIVMPDAGAKPFLPDLKALGKINQGARNLYRDAQLDLAGVGEKVRALIEEHIRATGVDPKIPPIDLLAVDYKKKLQEHKSDESKASEIENAIKHHIDINLAEDEEYYKSLSAKLNEILLKKSEHWDELVQLLLNFRDTIESDRKQAADNLGLNDTEFAFHNILVAEVSLLTGNESLGELIHDEIVQVTKALVEMMDEATVIVDFFKKPDEVKRVKKNIKRAIVASSFNDDKLYGVLTERFMALAQVKFK
ncbi:type I restriction endonuclease subunit R [Herminiimonas fonticola]|uniref:Type I restriction enzyme endonuclease subunit n=1 Tax=Herminiimonas fonticola TaxID=303380 RepID=A0A4R6G3S6_9BURK|nr:type I restriction endonuclease subunit R [Herminiimonas fonticola]RBA23284.1 hsdR: type I site-specific deoxyribonuclease, HsdR family [Herminiimonas fonticola]TDN89003.1 type I restriction enzyme R subunit [Herminiimonas fonticola]